MIYLALLKNIRVAFMQEFLLVFSILEFQHFASYGFVRLVHSLGTCSCLLVGLETLVLSYKTKRSPVLDVHLLELELEVFAFLGREGSRLFH